MEALLEYHKKVGSFKLIMTYLSVDKLKELIRGSIRKSG
jgi:hypothetical protein